MIKTGEDLHKNKIINNLIDPNLQVQPCGVDLTLKKIFIWKSCGMIDFDNSKRKLPDFQEIFPSQNIFTLAQGSYLVEFNEIFDVPLDLVGATFTRSSLFRSGVMIVGGLVDSGYEGAAGALMQVVNPHGVQLITNAKIAQYVFHQMESAVSKGYEGKYQGAKSVTRLN